MHNYSGYIRKIVQPIIDKNTIKEKSNNYINDKLNKSIILIFEQF